MWLRDALESRPGFVGEYLQKWRHRSQSMEHSECGHSSVSRIRPKNSEQWRQKGGNMRDQLSAKSNTHLLHHRDAMSLRQHMVHDKLDKGNFTDGHVPSGKPSCSHTRGYGEVAPQLFESDAFEIHTRLIRPENHATSPTPSPPSPIIPVSRDRLLQGVRPPHQEWPLRKDAHANPA
eukprot:scaffold9301_cov30-Tisochrysis_lutea.AAC.13